MDWEVELHAEVDSWFVALSEEHPEAAALVETAIDHLAEKGPRLGRPLVDHIKSSRHQNMKELRPPSAGRSVLRLLFAFDPDRRAIVLVAGDKAGDFKGWYTTNVPLADKRFDDHLDEQEKG